MKSWIKLVLLLIAVVAGLGFTPGFLTYFRIDVGGDPRSAVKALEYAVENGGGKLYHWDSPHRWYNVHFDADRSDSDYSAGNSFTIGFDVKGSHMVVVTVGGATAPGCSNSLSKAVELRAGARLKEIVDNASKASEINMLLSKARDANGDR